MSKFAAARYLSENFVRTNECRTKCGDDGKNGINQPDTEVENLYSLSSINRLCGCPMRSCLSRDCGDVKAHYEVKYVFCEYVWKFRAVPLWVVCCTDCAKHFNVKVEVSYSFEDTSEQLPSDVCPGIEFDKLFDPSDACLRNHDLYIKHNDPDAWRCGISLCCADLFVKEYVDLDKTIPHSPDNSLSDFDDLSCELDFERTNNMSPLPTFRVLTPERMNISVPSTTLVLTDDEVEQLIDDYTNCDIDISDDEQQDYNDYLKYNGYY